MRILRRLLQRPLAEFVFGSGAGAFLRGPALCFSVAVLCVFGGASKSFSQVTFDEVEAALSALEQSVGVVPAPKRTPPPQAGPTPPPDNFPDPPGSRGGDTQNAGGTSFLPLLTDQSCPRRIVEIGELAKVQAERARAVEADTLKFNRRFGTLEEKNRALEADREMLECPPDFVEDAEDLLNDLSQMNLASLVQEAETLSVCTQDGRQAVDARMSELAQSSDLDASRERLALGGVLERWAAADVQVSEAVSNFVFYDQRRKRLETATQNILRRCELLGGY